jgi:hypothetical protein
MIKLQTGDILCFKGKGFFSWIVRLLTWLQTGDKFQFSHIAMVYNDSLIASAEIKGFITITFEQAFKRFFRLVVFRYQKIDVKLQEKIKKSIERRLNTKYDLFMYFLNAIRINLFFIPGELVLAIFGGWKVFLITLVILIIIYWPVNKYLVYRERRTYGCSEVSSEILLENKMINGIIDSTIISPQVVYYILNNSKFEIIYDGNDKDLLI